jgi:hypothetical protein
MLLHPSGAGGIAPHLLGPEDPGGAIQIAAFARVIHDVPRLALLDQAGQVACLAVAPGVVTSPQASTPIAMGRLVFMRPPSLRSPAAGGRFSG